MRNFRISALCILANLLFWVSPLFAQTSQPTPSDLGFSNASLSFSALGVHGNGQTIPVADLNQNFAVMNTSTGAGNLSLRLDELLAASNSNFSAYMGGFKLFLPAIKGIGKTNLAPLKLYVSGEGGITRTTPALAGANPVNKAAGRAMFGANWNPTATGAMSFNIFEVGYGYLPGLVQGHNHFMTISAGLKLSF